MKKQIAVLTMAALLFAGCATHSVKTTSTDASGKPVTTTDKTSQSDNAAMNVIGSVVKYTGDAMTAILPPLIPLIVGGLTHPVTTPPASNATATP